jgi:hypothetical protein
MSWLTWASLSWLTCCNNYLADKLELRFTIAATAAMDWLTFVFFELAHLLQL